MSWIKMTREDKVGEFMKAAGKTKFKPGDDYDLSYPNNLNEEGTELLEAMWRYSLNPNDDNRRELCKEWADLQIVLSNIAWYFDIPADPAFNRVHLNNMTKIVDGKVILRADKKILKPEGYVQADMGGL